MKSCYEETPQWVLDLLASVRKDNFPELKDARFLVLMDGQKRESLGRIRVGKIKRASSEINFLVGEDHDYKITLDRLTFENLDDAQQIHVLYWLLCHCKVVVEDEKPEFKIVGPDFPIFAKEMEFNGHWRQTHIDIATKAAEVHANKPTVPENNPDAPNLFSGKDDAAQVECPYAEIRAEGCGQCTSHDECDLCCYGCEKQKSGHDGEMAEGCKILHEDAENEASE